MIHLHPTEHTMLKARRHWFVFFRSFVALLIIYLTPFILWRLISGGGIEFLPGEFFSVSPLLHPALLSFLSAGWTLLLWMKLFAVWTDYFLDIWLVTDERIVYVNQIGLFKREMATLQLSRVQDITVAVDGVVATFLNFGDIHVQTAAEEKEFVMRGISRPEHVKKVILMQMNTAASAVRDAAAAA